MTSSRVRWGRLKLAHSASDDDAMVDSPAKPLKPTRFRRKNDDDAFGRHGNSELEGTSPHTRRRRSRFRRESNEEVVSNNETRNKKGLFARQREKIKEKKKIKRPPPKASGIKSDGDSADDESDVQNCFHPQRYEMDDGSVDDHRASTDCNYNSDNYQSDNYHSDTQLTTLVRSPQRKQFPVLADLRRQQFQEQQLALEIQRQSMRVIELADDSSESSVDSKPVDCGRIEPSLEDRNIYSEKEAPRKKVSFGEPTSSKENVPWASQPLPSESSTDFPLVPVRANTVNDVLDVSDSLDLSSIDYNSPEHASPAKATQVLQNPVPRRMSRERARYSVHHGSIKKRFRVRPYHCFPNPVSMTEEEIYADSLKISDKFVRLKSYLAPTSKSVMRSEVTDIVRERWGAPDEDGRIGALRVEVLGCVSLNRTKPDVSVYLVCGDVAFCTDALDGYRSPMWPSASRRACIFPLHHAYAKLYVGVFDVRKNKSKENDVFCGRVVIDVASIRPNSEYDTTLPLRASSFVYDKRKRGVIRIRFSLHWFSERAAVMSYFKSVKSRVDSCPLVEGQPAIPCADPKTFRNVAVTVYGQDLPGKYSRNAFRATMREFNLYQQNLRLVVKVLIMDVMLYEKPWMSLYLFGAAMYCVLLSSVRMVPAFIFGYILILYIENYRHFVANKDFHMGYQPLTIMEIGKALILNSDQKERSKAFFFEPANVEKLVRKRQDRAGQRLRRLVSQEDIENGTSVDEANDGEIKKMDHREFPFSERDAYPRFSVEDALAPGSNKADTGRLHGRLSVYYTPAVQPADTGSGDEDPDSAEDSERDDETVMTESQMLSDNMFDLESDHDEDEGCIEGVDSDYKRAMILQKGNAIEKRRIVLGPPQDSDVIGRKVPPQLQLKKVENMLNKVSKGVAVELVHAPPVLRASKSDTALTVETGMTAPSADLQMKMSKKARKIAFDDFDKLLGLQSKSGNPIHRIMSSFMGPLMRMIRVGVLIIRLSFNIGTWRDPYLSFWVLVGLSVICLILIVFPWRSFFGLLSLICLGPQNIYVRRYLEKKSADAAEKAMMDDSETTHSDKPSYETSTENKINIESVKRPNAKELGRSTSATPEESVRSKSDSKKGFFSKFRSTKSLKSDSKVVPLSQESFREHETEHDNEPNHERPAFSSSLHGGTVSRKIEPRAVAIPYTRLKKDRFYDWPPDPTVSRATAIDIYPEAIDDIDSLTASVPDVPMPFQEDGAQSSLRRRHIPDRGIPTSVSF